MVCLARSDGGPISPAAGQKRLLALLSILSASPEASLSRDRILLLLWSDGDPDKTRHALTQSLYHARRSLCSDDLFLPGSDIRLNPARITSDVADFVDAIAQRDWLRAAQSYVGPFLDDFPLAGVGEFERWASGHRRMLAERAAIAFEHLAEEATKVGDLTAAIHWRKRCLDLDALNTKAAIQLIEAMAEAGDRTGALRVAQLHETILRSELDVEPDLAFRELVAKLRRSTASHGTLHTANAASSLAPPTAPPSQTEAVSRPHATRVPRSARHFLWPIAAIGVVLAAIAMVSRFGERAEARAFRVDQRIVVAPFRVSGSESSLRFLREGIVELLSTRLGDESTTSPVDPGAVLGAWRSARLLDAPEAPREHVLRAADRFNASAVVLGSIVGNPRHMVITGTLARVKQDGPDRVAIVEGPLDSLAVMVDRLAGKLLILTAGEGERFADRITPSLRALREFLDGQAAYRAESYQRAMRHYDTALRLDSTFALAAMQLALVADRINVGEQHDRALAIAWANRFDLNDRDRAHLTAFAGPRYPQPSTEAVQLAAWEAAVVLSPERAEVWLELGERFVQSGRLLGVAASDRRAEHALRRAAELKPDDGTANRLLALLAARSGDTVGMRLRLELAGDTSSDGPNIVMRWRTAYATGDASRLNRVRGLMAQLDGDALRAIALTSQYDAVGVDDGERALRIRGRRGLRAYERLDEILAQHSLALNQGRPIVALDLTEQLEESQPGTRAHLRLRVLDAIYGDGDTAAARRAALALQPHAMAPLADLEASRALQLADICVVAQWRLSQGRSDGVRRMIALLREAGIPNTPVPVGANPHTCAALLEAVHNTTRQMPNAVNTLARVDALMLGGPAASDASAYGHIVMARLWERLGYTDHALAAIRRRPYLAGWPRYLATARREEGRLATRLGDRNGAASVYREYLALRHAPELRVQSEVMAVRAAEATLHDGH